jgi:prepilin-type N-terminal cleavage/methylation domain-containing protein
MRGNGGYSLIEILITMAIIFLLASIAIPVYQNAVRQSRESSLAADCKMLYDAMMRYHADHGSFPSEGEFDTATLAPLTTGKYVSTGSAITSKLQGNELSVYVAPDVGGEDQQFIIVTRHEAEPSIVVVAVHTNIVGEAGGWVDGVYIISEDDLEEAGELG